MDINANLLISQLAGILSVFVKHFLKKLVGKLQIKKLVENSTQGARQYFEVEGVATPFIDWMKKDFVSEICDLINNNDTDVPDKIKTSIQSKAIECGIGESISSQIADSFEYDLLKYIQKKNPNLYTWIVDKSSLRLMTQGINEANAKLDNENRLLRELCQSNQLKTPSQWFQGLKTKTKNPSIGEAYFEVDDNDFINVLQSCLSLECLAIKYYCREEAVGCVCNTLCHFDLHKKILIVENKQTWDRLRKQGIKDAILLADFDSKDEIECIEGNLCILFLEESTLPNQQVIELPRRKLKSLQQYLQDAGASLERATCLIEETKGIYYSLLYKIHGGKGNDYYFLSEEIPAILTLLVFPCIIDDETVYNQRFRAIFNCEYNRFKEVMNKRLRNADPIVLKRRETIGSNHKMWMLTSLERAWCQFGDCVEEEKYSLYLNSLRNIFSNSAWTDQILLSERQLLYIFRSITCCGAIARKEFQPNIDSFVFDILDDSLSNGSFENCMKYGYQFIQLSPEGFLGFLERNKRKIVSLFNNGDLQDDYKIATALSKALLYKGYSSRAFLLAAYFHHNIKRKGTFGPHLEETLRYYLLPWINVSGEPDEAILSNARYCMRNYRDSFWDILFGAMRSTTGPVIGVSVTYRKENEQNEVTEARYMNIVNGYLKLLSEDADPIQVLELMKWPTYPLKMELLNKFRTQLEKEINGKNDPQLFEIALRIHDLVCDAREFRRVSYAGEDKQQFLEDLWHFADSLPYKNKAYQYLRVFLSDYLFHLKTPQVYDASMRFDYEIEKKAKENEKLALWEQSQKHNCTIDSFLLAIDEVKSSKPDITFDVCGTLLTVYQKIFDRHAYDSLVKNNNYQDAARFAAITLGQDGVVPLIEEAADKPGMLVELLKTREVDDITLKSLSRVPRDISVEFWKRPFYNDVPDKGILLQTVHMAMQAKAYGPALEIIMGNSSLLSLDELLTHIYQCVIEDRESLRHCSNAYLIKRYLLEHKREIIANVDNLHKALCIELDYRDAEGADNTTVFLDAAFQKDPSFFLTFLSWIYLNDDGNRTSSDDTGQTNERIGSAYVLLLNSGFCPGFIDGTFDSHVFQEWMKSAEEYSQERKMTKAFHIALGMLFGKAKVSIEGSPLPKDICEYIEKEESDLLENELYLSIMNRRGVYALTQGAEEMNLAVRFNSFAEALEEQGWLRAAAVYRKVSRAYERQSHYYADSARDELE